MNLWKGPKLEPSASGATLENLPGFSRTVSDQASWSNSPPETITADVQTPFLGKFQKVCDSLRSHEIRNWHFDAPHHDTLQFNIPRITLTCCRRCCCLSKIQYTIYRGISQSLRCVVCLLRDAAKWRRREILHVCIQFIGFLTITSSQRINPGIRIIPVQERKQNRDYRTLSYHI